MLKLMQFMVRFPRKIIMSEAISVGHSKFAFGDSLLYAKRRDD